MSHRLEIFQTKHKHVPLLSHCPPLGRDLQKSRSLLGGRPPKQLLMLSFEDPLKQVSLRSRKDSKQIYPLKWPLAYKFEEQNLAPQAEPWRVILPSPLQAIPGPSRLSAGEFLDHTKREALRGMGLPVNLPGPGRGEVISLNITNILPFPSPHLRGPPHSPPCMWTGSCKCWRRASARDRKMSLKQT